MAVPKLPLWVVGGGGSNAVDSMGDGTLEGVEFIVVNTDIQALQRAKTPRKIHIGKSITKGLGTGANPILGEQAANEDRDLIRAELEGADLVFCYRRARRRNRYRRIIGYRRCRQGTWRAFPWQLLQNPLNLKDRYAARMPKKDNKFYGKKSIP